MTQPWHRADMSPRQVAICVITVDDGPGDRRWALVSIDADALGARSEVTSSRHTEPSEVLARVTEFLADAALDRRT